MLNAMHARHIISRSSSASSRNDQLNSSLFRWTSHAISMTRWVTLKRAIVETKRVKTDVKTVNVDVKTRSLISNWESCWESCWSICMHSNFKHFVLAIFNFFNILLFLHNSIKSNNNLWRCFWHDSVLYAS